MSLSTGKPDQLLARWNKPTVTVWAGPCFTLPQIQEVKTRIYGSKKDAPSALSTFIGRKCREWNLNVEPCLALPLSKLMGKSDLVVIIPLAWQNVQISDVKFTPEGLQFVALPEADDASLASVRQILAAGPEEDVSEWAARYKKIASMKSFVESEADGVAKKLFQQLALLFNTTTKDIPIGFIQEVQEREEYEKDENDNKAGLQNIITG